MKTIAELTTLHEIKKLSSESERQKAKEILAYDHFEFEESDTEHVLAWVTVPSGHTRRVTLEVEPEGLVWGCDSKEEKKGVFCKHAVAVALKLAEIEDDL